MKPVLRLGLILICFGLLVLLVVARYYRAEHYQIVHTAFFPTTNWDALEQPAILCYSNEELKQSVNAPAVQDKLGMKSFDLDRGGLIACVLSNYVVEKVVGRQNFGLIILRKSQTNGISFTVFKGTKRFLQFNYSEAQ